MASSGYILKKREEVEFDVLLHDIRLASEYAGLEARIDSDVCEALGDIGIYMMGNIADTYENTPGAQQWCMYIYSDSMYLHRFDYVAKNEHLIIVMLIEHVPDCEQILLDFLFEYFKLNPRDYFLVEEYEWYYTYEDIKKLKQNDFDPYWCCKDPHADDLN